MRLPRSKEQVVLILAVIQATNCYKACLLLPVAAHVYLRPCFSSIPIWTVPSYS